MKRTHIASPGALLEIVVGVFDESATACIICALRHISDGSHPLNQQREDLWWQRLLEYLQQLGRLAAHNDGIRQVFDPTFNVPGSDQCFAVLDFLQEESETTTKNKENSVTRGELLTVLPTHIYMLYVSMGHGQHYLIQGHTISIFYSNNSSKENSPLNGLVIRQIWQFCSGASGLPLATST